VVEGAEDDVALVLGGHVAGEQRADLVEVQGDAARRTVALDFRALGGYKCLTESWLADA
jgi:hypothetical protein